MKRVLSVFMLFSAVVVFLFASGCKKDDKNGDGSVTLPTVATQLINNITMTGATCKAAVIADGGGTITERGVCWSINPTPTISDNKASAGTGTGTFNAIIEGLVPNTFYYVRAYATNSAGTEYGDELFLRTYTGTVTDVEGNVYYTVTILGIEFMASNLKVTKYNDGTPIQEVTDNNAWSTLSTPAYCWYENNYTTYGSVYGALYNWYAAEHDKLCPVGWSVPDLQDFQLVDGLAGGKSGELRAPGTEHWESPNLGATNKVGFTGYGSGRRDYVTGNFIELWVRGNWWTREESSAERAYQMGVYFNSQSINKGPMYKNYGFSIRCRKNHF